MTQAGIEVRALWKKFHRGEVHDSLRDLVPAFTRRVVGRRPPSDQLQTGDFWALKDLTFDVLPGQTLGVIGQNGAGKSTLLKVLTRILRPTRGSCRIQGRVGALIEVAAGFHPDLTGRENIFLQGAIMGMPQADIRRKFDAIVDFSGIIDFIDTPVKRYSSGMNARLGFSIAAHLDPDVLIVDEVLAVGDFGFQQRAFGRIAELARSGLPVIVVSHQLDRIAALCTHGILLDRGAVIRAGTPAECITAYTLGQGRAPATNGSHPVVLETLTLAAGSQARSGAEARLRITGEATDYDRHETDSLGIRVRALHSGEVLFSTGTGDFGLHLPERGRFELELDLQLNVAPGLYAAESFIWDHLRGQETLQGPTLVLEVEEGTRFWGTVQMNPRMDLASSPDTKRRAPLADRSRA
ncbi:MAG TPA: ABC transporter ATP-binding protein [Gemmatimonadales bacterium]|nr:ABC transporter ATP-binding protein [Gemmatimonadales bacterium]